MTKSQWHGFIRVLAVLMAVLLLNSMVWWWLGRARALPVLDEPFHGAAYAPFGADQSPRRAQFPSKPELLADLDMLKREFHALRVYSSTEVPALTELAAERGFAINQGAWLSADSSRNEQEFAALIAMARTHPQIKDVIVGNETLLRGELNQTQLVNYLRRARAALKQPVSTAENWDFWLAHPEIADEVDYLAVHILPYWEGVHAKRALAQAKQRLQELRKLYPNKRIVVAEYGWPSQGERFQDAIPSVLEQARFVRSFALELKKQGIDGFVMEAVDQPWKAEQEGRVGAYWGMFNAERELKWSRNSEVRADPEALVKGLVAVCLAMPLLLAFVLRWQHLHLGAQLVFAVLLQTGVSLLVWLFGIPLERYLNPLEWVIVGSLAPAYVALVALSWTHGLEWAECFGQSSWRRTFGVRIQQDRLRKVSVHLPCHNEPPEMVISTLDSLASMRYQNFEVLVIDNNTADDALWKPVQAHCQKLGVRFKFFHLQDWPGFKAGALNFALTQTAVDAEVIAVVDSDYVVRAHWLGDLLGHFEDDQVVVVQSPQAHRELDQAGFRRMASDEFDGFFRIGMHHRHERNAIIQHGTMTLIRKQALLDVGAWAEWCICEDAELGLRLIKAGGELRYVDIVMGQGLTPADFGAYKTQRFRWAFGAMQILKAHGKALLLRGREPSALTLGQRFHFLTGWFAWFADAVQLFTSLALVLYGLGMAWNRQLFPLPLDLYLIPVLGFAAWRAIASVVLYLKRVSPNVADAVRASAASMALSHTIARGVLKGLWARKHPFERTAKRRRGQGARGAWSAVREEFLLALALLICTIAVLVKERSIGLEHWLWISLLLVQSVPYWCSLFVAQLAARPLAQRAHTQASDTLASVNMSEAHG
jgi:exo-beta-1,3-glucanase (GH17 family)